MAGEAAQPVVDHDVLDAGGEHERDDRTAGGAGTRDDGADRGEVLADHAQGVGERGEHDDRGAVLVVVEDRDVEGLAQPSLDLEASRRRDVLEVDAPEAGCDQLDGADDLVGVLGVQADRPGVDVGEPLEQRRLALHHRQRRARADVAQAEHRRPVGDHRDGVALDRQPAHVLGVLGQREADPADAGGVGHREVVAVAQRHLGGHLDLAADVQQEDPVAGLVDRHARHRAGRLLETLGVLGVGRGAGDVDDQALVGGLGHVDAGDDAPDLGDRGRHGTDDAVVGRGVQAHGDRVRRGGGGSAGGTGHLATLRPRLGYRQVTLAAARCVSPTGRPRASSGSPPMS